MTGMNIGDREVPSIQDIDPEQEQPTEEINPINLDDPVLVEHAADLTDLDIEGKLVEMLHSDDLSIPQQRQALRALVSTPKARNSIDYQPNTTGFHWTGWLSVEEVDAPEDGARANVQEVTISAQYLPYSNYQRATRLFTHPTPDQFGLDRPGLVTLPSYVQNVRIRNPRTSDAVSLTPIATETTSDGDVDLYRYPPWYRTAEASNFGSSRVVLDQSADGLESVNYTDTDGRSFHPDNLPATHRLPAGEYAVAVRARDDSGVTDSLTVQVEYDTDGGPTWEQLLTERQTINAGYEIIHTDRIRLKEQFFDYNGVRIKTTTPESTSNVHVAGARYVPNFIPELVFDVPVGEDLSTVDSVALGGTSFTVPERLAPVRVYDDMGASNDPSQWVQVQNANRPLKGAVVLENGMLRIRPASAKVWVNDPNGWQRIQNSAADWNNATVTLQSVTPEEATYRVIIEGREGGEAMFNGSLARGDYYVTHELQRNDTVREWFTRPTSYTLSAYVDSVYHDVTSGTSDNVNTNTDNWATLLDPSRQHLPVYGGSVPDAPRLLRDHGGSDVDEVNWSGISQPGDVMYWGALPFAGAANLYAEAENEPGGGSVNHWEMPLRTDGALNEHTGDTGNFTLNTTDGILEHSRDGQDGIYLNALQWGESQDSKHYRWSFQASDTTDNEYCRTKFGSQNQIANESEYSVLQFISNDTVRIRHWDSTGNSDTIGQTSFSFAYGTLYHAEIEWTPSSGEIDVYVWADGNGKPSSPTVSATDTTYSSGYTGYVTYGSVDLHGWSVDAEETTSSGDATLICPSSDIYGTAYNGAKYEVSVPDDIPKGTYYCLTRYKTTNTAADAMTYVVYDRVNGEEVHIDGDGKFKNITTSGDYNYIHRYARFEKSSDGVFLNCRMTSASGVEHVIADEHLFIPVSLQSGGDRMGPQDVMHEALTDVAPDPTLLDRDRVK